MITDERMKHILQVARKMYQQAKDEGLSEEAAREFFLVGYLHDIGYEWGDNKTHPDIATNLLTPYLSEDMVEAIQTHGDPEFPVNKYSQSLNAADMTTDKAGRSVTLEERLEDIGSRYGIDSDTFQLAEGVANRLQ